ncbi:MAG: DUF2953 domain-containing protein [Lachnospiraceae bacterium]|nr:DUF2953 domain-containing protein [Lachnospiraceae bacterium]
MLGILLGILKIIGITLLIILAVILALVLILLFVPLRYRLEASYLTGDISVSAKVRFLFPLLSVYFDLEKGNGKEVSEKKHIENGMAGGVKIFGFRVFNFFPTEEEKKKQEEKKRIKQAKKEARQAKKDERLRKKNKGAKPQEEAANLTETDLTLPAEGTGELGAGNSQAASNDTVEDSGSINENGSFNDAEEFEDEEDDFQPGLIEKIRLFLLSLGDAYAKAFDALLKVIDYLAALPDQLEERKQSIVKTFRKYKRNLKRIICIWEKDYTKRALQKAKKALLKILRAIRPRKGYLKATVGMEDVALTGQIAGYYGMLYGMFYPFVGKRVTLTPDFDRNIQDAEVFMKGHIRLCTFLRAAWLWFFDKDIKRLKAITKKAIEEF